jgi:hypothetical protein
MNESRSGSVEQAVTPFLVMLAEFVEGRMSANEVESAFLPLYRTDAAAGSPDVFEILDRFFGDVEAYRSGECGPEELHASACRTLELLEIVVQSST